MPKVLPLVPLNFANTVSAGVISKSLVYAANYSDLITCADPDDTQNLTEVEVLRYIGL